MRTLAGFLPELAVLLVSAVLFSNACSHDPPLDIRTEAHHRFDTAYEDLYAAVYGDILRRAGHRAIDEYLDLAERHGRGFSADRALDYAITVLNTHKKGRNPDDASPASPALDPTPKS